MQQNIHAIRSGHLFSYTKVWLSYTCIHSFIQSLYLAHSSSPIFQSTPYFSLFKYPTFSITNMLLCCGIFNVTPVNFCDNLCTWNIPNTKFNIETRITSRPKARDGLRYPYPAKWFFNCSLWCKQGFGPKGGQSLVEHRGNLYVRTSSPKDSV